jgi:hypothetical protein
MRVGTYGIVWREQIIKCKCSRKTVMLFESQHLSQVWLLDQVYPGKMAKRFKTEEFDHGSD